MRAKIILTMLFSLVLAPAAFCWEYTFDADQGWSYFDGDTGAGVPVAPSGGVLSVDYPDYSFVSLRYVFADKDSSPFFGNKDLTGGYVSATVSYSGSVAPTFAYFFFAGAGDAGDDQVYLTGEPGSWEGGSQTFWAASDFPLDIGTEFASTGTFNFDTDTFAQLSVGPEHDAQRGSADSWGDSITSVDAVGIVLGYVGTPPGDAQLNIDEFTVTPEPHALLLMGPLAGFLGWRIRRRGKRTATKA